MPKKAQYATVHRFRFPQITTKEMLQLSAIPPGALSWRIGPSGEVGPDGYRLPADVWCAVGLFGNQAQAQAALQAKEQFMPFLESAAESWHALLLPFAHKGECNLLDREHPGPVFENNQADPGGLCMVITTAGFVLGPDFKVERAIDFRRNVDQTNAWMAQAEGCIANQVFTPHTVGDDGFTLSIWRDDASMLAAAYRPGVHRSQLDRSKLENVFDRSSFTRCRILYSLGEWNGRNPAEI